MGDGNGGHRVSAKAQRGLCMECGRRPAAKPKRRCTHCLLRGASMDEQAEAARRRLAMVPVELRQKLTRRMREQAPEGTRWCAGCQSFRDEIDFGGSKQTQCHACRSGRAHAAMVEKTYGITADEYSAILRLQGGGCAICGARPKNRRLAVDHDHKTGAVRGLLCSGNSQSGCNFGLGLFHDDAEIVWRAFAYMTTPPAQRGEEWKAAVETPPAMKRRRTQRPAAAPRSRDRFALPSEVDAPRALGVAPEGTVSAEDSPALMVLPVGAEAVPGKPGVWRVFVEPSGVAPF